MLVEAVAGGNDPGLWILEGVPLAGKTTLLRRWRAASLAPVLWSAEDSASQRLFEPLETRHHPGAVMPWLRAMVDAWERLHALAAETHQAEARFAFAAHQERFHLSADLDQGLGPGDFEALEARLEGLGARGVLLQVGAEELDRRLLRSLEERPPTWAAWLERRYGGLRGAAQDFLARQERLRERARSSRLPWLQGPG